jgi:hypothetical protein
MIGRRGNDVFCPFSCETRETSRLRESAPKNLSV